MAIGDEGPGPPDPSLNDPQNPPPPGGGGGGGGGGGPFTFVPPGVVRRGSGPVQYGRKVENADVYGSGGLTLQNQGGDMNGTYSTDGTASPTGNPYDVYAPQVQPGSYTPAAGSDPGLPPSVAGKHDAKYIQHLADWTTAHQQFQQKQGDLYMNAIRDLYAAERNGSVRRAQIGADLYGNNDPLAGMYARGSAETSANEQYPALVARAQADWQRHASDMSFQEYMAQLQSQLQMDANKQNQHWYDPLLQVAGTGLGAFAGGYGEAAGKKAGG